MSGEIIVYVPAPGHPAADGIDSGSAIVGRPEPGSDDVRIYYEGALYGQVNMKTLADRAVHACGRLQQDYPTTAAKVVPRDALTVVGTFDPRGGRIMLTGRQSERAVADWLGVSVLDPAELEPERPRR
jgi:hypothetical protein